MFGILKLKLIEAVRGLQHACATAVLRDDDGDDGDIATPKICFDDEPWTRIRGRWRRRRTAPK